jgi:hypothetical protein
VRCACSSRGTRYEAAKWACTTSRATNSHLIMGITWCGRPCRPRSSVHQRIASRTFDEPIPGKSGSRVRITSRVVRLPHSASSRPLRSAGCARVRTGGVRRTAEAHTPRRGCSSGRPDRKTVDALGMAISSRTRAGPTSRNPRVDPGTSAADAASVDEGVSRGAARLRFYGVRGRRPRLPPERRAAEEETP